ncbi:MAG: phosphotransferase [Polyangiaceae bacterium]
MSASELPSVIREGQISARSTAVDKAVFDTDSPAEIASLLSGFCTAHLGAPIADAMFYRVAAACVAGLRLADGRAVVVKAQRGGRPERYLTACADLRRLLVEEGFPCPLPLTGPVRLGSAWVTAEELMTAGARADAHDPAIREAIARSLARMIAISERFEGAESFGRAWFSGLPEGRVFPKPHSPMFDFDATAGGAEWIESLAAEARERRKSAEGPRVIGHFDYRVEHLRFEGGQVVASFDWDSLHFEQLPVLIGSLAPHFTFDWQRNDLPRAPTLDEMRAFVSDFEAARGQPFSAAERATLTASLVYAMAYTARCNHASTPHFEGWNGDLRPMLRAHGRTILDKGL